MHRRWAGGPLACQAMAAPLRSRRWLFGRETTTERALLSEARQRDPARTGRELES